MKLVPLAASVAAICIAAYAGATQYNSSSFQQALAELPDNTDLPPSLKLEVVSAENGLLQSSGTLRWRLSDPGTSSRFTSALRGADMDPARVSGEVRYTVEHTPGLSGWSRYRAVVAADGPFGDWVSETTGENILLRTSGQSTLAGALVHAFETPAVTYDSEEVNVRIPVSTGAVSTDRNGVSRFEWSLRRAAATAVQGSYSVTGVRLAGVVEDMQLQTGHSTLDVDSIEAGNYTLTALHTNTRTSEANGSLDSVLSATLDKISGSGPEVTGLQLAVETTGFDAQALRTVHDVLNEMNGQVEVIDRTQALTLEKALARLLDRGATLSMPTLKGSADGKPFSASWQLALQPGNAQTAMADRLVASGQVAIDRNLLPSPFLDMAMGSGYVRAANGQLSAQFKLARAEMTVNEQPLPIVAMQLQPMLQMVDAQIQQWRSGLSEGQPSLLVPMKPI